jgi:TatD DNase family protein
LRLAVERDLPVLIHCRRGWDRLLRCIKEIGGARGIIHAFSGSREILRECLNLGFYISFAGMVTRPHSYRAHEAATLVPADRLLLETDAPCMALEGIPGGQSEPIHLLHVLHYVAQLRKETPEAIAAQVAENVTALFR